MLSKRIQALKPSPTLALAAKAKQLIAEGQDVVSLTVGEPDWPTYEAAKQAGKKAIDDNKTTYTPASGIPQLKEAICQLVGPQLSVDLKPSQVTIASGAKYIIYTALTAILDPGDEVIIPSPYWVSYPTMVELAGGTPHIVSCDGRTDFKMTAEALEQSIGPKTKAVLMNSPSNPTGAEYSIEELSAIAEVLKKHPNIFILSDDIYNQLSFGDTGLSPHILNVEPGFFDRCLAINGMSKAYSMTGWRMGWATGPENIIKAMGSFQSQTTGAPSSISQWASVTAITECHEEVKKSLEVLKTRRSLFMDELSQVEGLKCFAPQGAFYLWVSTEEWIGKKSGLTMLNDSRDVSRLLLDEQKVAVVPGQEFGLDGYLRLSFAASEDNLRKASKRLKTFAQSLS
ncbi:MAG: pyridoxal phosphate-dependent aminotransferase [Pseudomonadota bacterium]